MKSEKKGSLRFDTSKNERSGKAIRFAAAFCIFLLVFGGASALVLLKYYDFDLSKMIEPPPEETSAFETQPVRTVPEVEGEENFLFFCSSDSGAQLRFTALVHADMDNLQMTVCALGSDTVVNNVNNFSGTLTEHLLFGGSKQLKSAVETLTGVGISKYVRSTDNEFRACIKEMGGLTVVVPEKIDWRTGEMTVIIQQGEQLMGGDTLHKYLLYNAARPGVQADVICRMLDSYIVPEFTDRAEALFGSLVNRVETDISAMDFNTIRRNLEAFANSPERKRAMP